LQEKYQPFYCSDIKVSEVIFRYCKYPWTIILSKSGLNKHCIWIVDEWKTNLMSLAILFHLLRAQHVSDINISIFRRLRLCCWITTSVVLFCKDGWFSISVTLRCVVVCVWCDVFCHLVVVGRCILIDFDRYLLCFVTILFVRVWYFLLVVWYLVPCWCTKYQTTNEKYHTQTNTMITKHNR